MTLAPMTPEQQNVVDYLNRDPGHVFITGRAGTGKSHVLRWFQATTTKNVLVCAPTGVAALNVDGMTIHNLMGLGTGLPADSTVDIEMVRRKKSMLLEANAIVIDEVSMVSSDLMDAVDRTLRAVRNDSMPFGGLQMIFFGDLYQLPPVKTQEFEQYLRYMDYRSAWFFDAHVWEETDFKTFGLNHVHRQHDGAFKDLLNGVRDGTITEKQLAELNEIGKHPRTKNSLLLGSRKKAVHDFNTKNLAKLPGHQRVFKAYVNKEWGARDPAEREIKLKSGAKVIMLSNDRQDRWVNGTEAVIRSITMDTLWLTTEDGRTHEVPRFQWVPAGTHPEDYRRAPKFTQFPVKLAWGVTIHKSQGMTKQDIEIDLGSGAFEAGQTYVALSRVTAPEGLHLKNPLRMSDIQVDHHVRRFFDELD